MFNIYVLDLFLTNGFSIFGIKISVLACIITGILVIIIINPIVSVLFLIGLFMAVSSNLMFLGLNFIGLSYLLVYVGAVTILFLFILMLINIRISEIVSSTRNSIPLAIALGLLFFSTVYSSIPIVQNYIISNENQNFDSSTLDVAGFDIFVNYFTINNSFLPGLLQFVPSLGGILSEVEKENLDLSDRLSNYAELKNYFFLRENSNSLNNVFSNSWDINISDSTHIVTLGNILYTSYPILILLTSLVLLLSMVGCIIITVRSLPEHNNKQKYPKSITHII